MAPAPASRGLHLKRQNSDQKEETRQNYFIFFLNWNIKNKNQRAKMPNIFGTEIEEVYYYEIV